MGSKRDINSLRLSIHGRAKGKEKIMVADMNLPAARQQTPQKYANYTLFNFFQAINHSD